MSQSPEKPIKTNQSSTLTKLAIVGVAAAIVGGYWFYGDAISLETLAGQEAQLRTFQVEHPWLVFGLAFALYVAVTGFSLPGAAVLTLAYGWYFGLLPGFALVSFASTTGATVAFLLSRTLLRDSIQSKFGDKLVAFNENLRREGAFYLFTLRLIPAVPFFVINVVMGLTPMKTRTFWWVSQVGMLPGTVAFVYAGSTFPSLQALADNGPGGIITLPLLAAFAVLGLFPLAAKKVVALVKRNQLHRLHPSVDAV